jgi:hypothetical protein
MTKETNREKQIAELQHIASTEEPYPLRPGNSYVAQIALKVITSLQEELKGWQDSFQKLSNRFDDQANESISQIVEINKLKEENEGLKAKINKIDNLIGEFGDQDSCLDMICAVIEDRPEPIEY